MKSYSLILVAISLAFLSCGKEKSEVTEAPRPVKYTTLSSQNTYRQEFSGIVQSDKFADLAFRVSGQLIKLNVDFGQKVKQGELIAEIDPRDLNLQVEKTASGFETAKLQLERNKILYERNAISKQEMEMSMNNYNSAKVNYENAKNSLKDSKLYAPFTGSIEKRMVSNYQRVQAGEPIVKLIDPTDIMIWFTVPDNNLKQAKNQFQFSVEFMAIQGKVFKAKIKEVLDVSPDGIGIPVLLVIDDPEFKQYIPYIKPGFNCRVILQVTGAIKTNNKVVPMTAIFKDGKSGKDCIWIIDENNQAQSTPIKIINPSGTDMVIIEGDNLEDGAKVVTAGVQRLVEGEKVKAQ